MAQDAQKRWDWINAFLAATLHAVIEYLGLPVNRQLGFQDFIRAYTLRVQARLRGASAPALPRTPSPADFFYRPNVLIFCDGPHHDLPSRQALDATQRRHLLTLGYRVITLRYDQDLEQQVRQYPEVFGAKHIG